MEPQRKELEKSAQQNSSPEASRHLLVSYSLISRSRGSPAFLVVPSL